MLEVKRNRKLNKKYSDFVQIPLTKRDHAKAEQKMKDNEIVVPLGEGLEN